MEWPIPYNILHWLNSSQVCLSTFISTNNFKWQNYFRCQSLQFQIDQKQPFSIRKKYPQKLYNHSSIYLYAHLHTYTFYLYFLFHSKWNYFPIEFSIIGTIQVRRSLIIYEIWHPIKIIFFTTQRKSMKQKQYIIK